VRRVFGDFGDVEFLGAARLMDSDDLESARAVLALPLRDLVGNAMADVAGDRPEVDQQRFAFELFRLGLTAVDPRWNAGQRRQRASRAERH